MSKLRRRLAKYWPVTKILFLTLLLFCGGFLGNKSLAPILKTVSEIAPNVIGTTSLKNDADRINIAVLGVGGENHDGPNLTDTIIIASVPATKSGTIFLISIPRDIYFDNLSDKINSAYKQGEEKKPGGGFILTKAVLAQITGLPIHYAVKVDFIGFAQIIDILGGVDINIENSFSDEMYPIVGKETDDCGGNDLAFKCRYETINFIAGPTHMDGSTALRFARSRHSLDLIEGTDFARSARQQKLISAVKHKAISSPTLLSPKKLSEIYRALKTNLTTDATGPEINSAIKLGLKIKDSILKSIVLPEALFINPPIDYRGWILLPISADFSNIKEFITQTLTSQ